MLSLSLSLFSLYLFLSLSLSLSSSFFLSLSLSLFLHFSLFVSLSSSLHLNLSLSNEMKVKKDYLSIRVVLKTDSEMDLFIQPCGFRDSTIHIQGKIQLSRLVIYSCTTNKIKVFTIVVRIKL